MRRSAPRARTSVRQVSASANGYVANSVLHVARRIGAEMPRYGIVDFMYACMAGARAGSATARSALRTRVPRVTPIAYRIRNVSDTLTLSR